MATAALRRLLRVARRYDIEHPHLKALLPTHDVQTSRLNPEPRNLNPCQPWSQYRLTIDP
jgi:hypothetical protein